MHMDLRLEEGLLEIYENLKYRKNFRSKRFFDGCLQSCPKSELLLQLLIFVIYQSVHFRTC